MPGPKTRQEQLEKKPYLGETGPSGAGGTAGGDLQRKKGSKDELKRTFERPSGVTRVRKSDEKNDQS
jgi:hypothetical protein